MDSQDIITIIFILIFILGPLIKKIWSVLTGGGNEETPRKQETLEEVKKYLEEMRASQEPVQQQKQYRAPATRPSAKVYDAKNQPGARKGSKKKEVLVEAQEPVKISTAVEQNAQVFAAEKGPEKTVPVVGVIHRLISDSRFSETQKAIIFSEIFKKPKGVSN